jgi:pimeloyl-ACP methyl ester carboxylesterase
MTDGVSWRMPPRDDLRRRAASNFEAVRMDLEVAHAEADLDRARLLDTLMASGGAILIYRPQLQHYALLFGDLDAASHIAVFVPGVGDGTNLCEDWIPGALNLYEEAQSTAVVMWKGYDNPVDILAAVEGTIECDEHLMTAGSDLVAFVESLDLTPEQTLTIVAHSFGSIVTGTALADFDLKVTDVVVAGSPGMTVDELRQLHVTDMHFFSEQAPGDAIAELGVFGASPASPEFGGTRMEVNAPDHPEVAAHSHYFDKGSEALENIADVVTGHYDDVRRHHSSLAEVVGGIVTWALQLPVVPVRVASRRYRGPGFRLITNACRVVDFGASQTGNLVCEAIDHSERALVCLGRRVGAVPAPDAGSGAPAGRT